MNLRPKFSAATAVVPLPVNGSNTTSPGLDELRISVSTIWSGFTVGNE